MSRKKEKIERHSNVKQPEGVHVSGGRPCQTVSKGVLISSTTNTANPDMRKGVEIQGGGR